VTALVLSAVIAVTYLSTTAVCGGSKREKQSIQSKEKLVLHQLECKTDRKKNCDIEYAKATFQLRMLKKRTVVNSHRRN
jgi:hypothetical protein